MLLIDNFRLYLSFCLICIVLLVTACGRSSEPLPKPDPTIAAPLVEQTFFGTMKALSGEDREVTLTLLTDVEGDYVFSLDYLFVGRSLRPTNRTGLWHYDGSTLTLDIIEQDGEPVDQPELLFATTPGGLIGTVFDKAYFDVETLVLDQVEG